MNYKELPQEELKLLYENCKQRYDELKAKGLKLDMSRGKPGADQLDISVGLMSALSHDDYLAEDGTDCRNYGGIDGIPEMKRLFAELFEVKEEEILVGGNASLTLMYESLCANFMVEKNKNSKIPNRKFLCPSPGYDRHFTITEYLGMEMITIPMTPTGPDIAEVKKHIADPAVAGIWCVPVYSNPEGVVYSDEVIRELAALKPAADDFRILWDNAYMLHPFEGEAPKVANLLKECEKSGNYDMPLMYMSFSKITFPGAGICAMAASPSNLKKMREHLIVHTIGPDKLNQLRHMRYFKDASGVRSHMKKHAAVLKPKFETVLNALSANLEGKGIGEWLKPSGGYFIAFDTLPGCAKRTIALCAEAGLVMTSAGATYPHGKDPEDKNIRIAPTFPNILQLEQAMALFCIAVELASLEKLNEKN